MVALISQLPAGVLVDAVRNKRVAAGVALIGVIIAALLLAIQPTELPVLVAQSLHAFSSCMLTPAIAAISLHLVGHTGAGRTAGTQRPLRRDRQWAGRGGDGRDGRLPVQPRGVRADRGALRSRAAVAAGNRPRPACQTTDDDQSRSTGPGCDDCSPTGACSRSPPACCCSTCPTPRCCRWSAPTVTMRAGDFANLIIAACIVVPQGVVALVLALGGTQRRAASGGVRCCCWAGPHCRCAACCWLVLPGAWLPIAAQAVSGISAAVFGVMLPLIAADITRGTSHFNLCMGVLGLAVCLGAALSTTLGGWIADLGGVPLAFAVLALVGVLATLVVWLAMPETRQE